MLHCRAARRPMTRILRFIMLLPLKSVSPVAATKTHAGSLRRLRCFVTIQLWRSEPNLPRHLAALDHVLQDLLVFEGVHGAEETFVTVGDELAGLDEALKRFDHELLTFFDVVENLVPKYEIAGVNPDV